MVDISRSIRAIAFTNAERKRLTDRVGKAVETIRGLEHQAQNIERRAELTRNEDQKKELRKQVRQIRSDVEKMEQDAGVTFQELRRTQRDIIQGEMDAERAKFADNTLRYEAAMRYLSAQIKTMLAAIQN